MLREVLNVVGGEMFVRFCLGLVGGGGLIIIVVMKKLLPHLPDEKLYELERICGIVEQEIPDLLFLILFGSYARGTWVEDEYVDSGVTYKYVSDYDLLAVVKNASTGKKAHLWDAVRNSVEAAGIETPVGLIYDDLDFVNEQLGAGQYFYSDIKREGVVLFDSRGELLVDVGEPVGEARAKLAREDFDFWFENGNQFYTDFLADLERGWLSKAAFELHQAAERFYTAINLVYMNYRPKTHELARLRMMAKSYDGRFGEVFPLHTSVQRIEFDLLCRAYVDAQYKKEFVITKGQLGVLGGRVKELKGVTETLCLEKIVGFEG